MNTPKIVGYQRAVWPGLFLACCLSLLTLTINQKLLAQTPNGVTVAGNVLSVGSLPNQLRFPFSVYLDSGGFMYVADYGNNRIQKFPPNLTTATSGSTVAGGQTGTGANQFRQPVSVFVDGAGFIYVADRDNNRIQKFPPNSTSATNGSTVAGGNGIGTTATKFENPYCVFVDGAGFIYVADQNNHRIQKFPPNSTSATSGSTVAGGNGLGSQANRFSYPSGVFVDGAGLIYVADQYNERIQKFPPNSTSATNGSTVAGGNGRGNLAGQFYTPSAVFVDGTGAIYIADQNNNRIQKFPPNSTSASSGSTVAGGNGIGPEPNKLNRPVGLFVNATGTLLYVAESDNHRVQRFGQFITLASTTVCAGQSNTLTASVTGGNVPFSYSFSSGATAIPGSTSLASVTAAGPYSVTVTDTFGVSSTATVISTFNPIPTISILPSSTAVCAGTSLTITASGANTYTWTPGNSTGTSLTVSPSATTTYTAMGTSTSGCTATAQASVMVNALPVLGSIASTSVACFGGTGSFTLSASNETTPYTFALNTGTSNQTGVFTGLLAGSYTVSLSDANSCSASSTSVITISQPASALLSSLAPSATGVCGSVSVTLTGSISGGTGPYQYNFGGGFSATSTSVVTPAFGNNAYSLTVTDASGCTAVSTTSVQGNSVPTATLMPTSATLTCTQTSVTLTAGGGGSYSFSTGTTVNPIVVSSVGTYSVLVTGANGCTASATATVGNDVAAPTVSITPGSTTFCGSLMLTASGMGFSGLLWNTGATTPGITVTATGPYSVTATGANGCTATASNSPTAVVGGLSLGPVASSSSVCEGGLVQVPVTVTGTPTSLQWYRNGSPVPGQLSATLTLNPVQANQSGSYTLVATGGCGTATSTAFNLTVNAVAPNVVITFPNGSTVVVNGLVPTITVSRGSNPTMQVSGGNQYERMALIDRINGYELRQVDTNANGIFPITRPGLFRLTITGPTGCKKIVEGIVQIQP